MLNRDERRSNIKDVLSSNVLNVSSNLVFLLLRKVTAFIAKCTMSVAKEQCVPLIC